MHSGSAQAAEDEEFCWGALVARVLHPAQVGIIEALRWINRSLSAAELSEIFEGQLKRPHIEHRLRQLARLDAVRSDEEGKGSPSTRQLSYCLVRHRVDD
jgi:hypothetical protein